jgi:hypothetical protein
MGSGDPQVALALGGSSWGNSTGMEEGAGVLSYLNDGG